MAGSKDTFIYFGDDGNKLVRLDESNTRALGAVPATEAAATAAATGRRIRRLDGSERYINCTGQTAGGRPVSRKLIVPTADNTFFVNGGTIELPVLVSPDNGGVELVTFRITNVVGEGKSFANLSQDTGLDDQA